MKQTIEIEVPSGKKAVWENNQIIFVDSEAHWESIKTFDDAYDYCYTNNLDKYTTNFNLATAGTYEEKVAKLRLVIAALTNNEKVYLTKGKLYFPVIQFCLKKDINNCFRNKIIGKIKEEGKEYLVVGGNVNIYFNAGISRSYFYDFFVSNSFTIGVSSKEIAEHLSTYFGKLIFEVMYGGSNCDWEWIE